LKSFAETPPVLYKDRESRAQHQAKSLLLSKGIAEPNPAISNEQTQKNLPIFQNLQVLVESILQRKITKYKNLFKFVPDKTL